MSKSRKDQPRLVNEDDSSSNHIPETQNNDNSFENVNEKSVHNDQSAKDVKKDTLNSVKNTLSMLIRTCERRRPCATWSLIYVGINT